MGSLDLPGTNAIIIFMPMDRSLCAICAWRGDCNKKFMQGNGVYCPDYTKDLTIRSRSVEKKEDTKPKEKKFKRTKDIHLL